LRMLKNILRMLKNILRMLKNLKKVYVIKKNTTFAVGKKKKTFQVEV
jgi:hypothetical protein